MSHLHRLSLISVLERSRLGRTIFQISFIIRGLGIVCDLGLLYLIPDNIIEDHLCW